MNYIDNIYDKKIRPITAYPKQLVKYLYDKYSMKPGQKILDIGCGRGEITKEFSNLKLKIEAVDKDKSKEHDFKIKYLDVEKDKFTYKNNTFDIVFSKSVLEHLSDPTNFMKEIYRILKPGGLVILMTPDWVSQMKIFFNDYTHKQPYTKYGLYDLLKIFNFKNIKTDLFYQLPILWKYPVLKIVSSIIRFLLPANDNIKNKFVRWSSELMILGSGNK